MDIYIGLMKCSEENVELCIEKWKNSVLRNLKEIAKDIAYYSPLDNDVCHYKGSFALTKARYSKIIDWAINEVFQYKIFYDKKLQVIGFCHDQFLHHFLYDHYVRYWEYSHGPRSVSCDYELMSLPPFCSFLEKWRKESEESVKTKYVEYYNCDWVEEDNPSCKQKHLEFYQEVIAQYEVWQYFKPLVIDEEKITTFQFFSNEEDSLLHLFVSFVIKKVKEDAEEQGIKIVKSKVWSPSFEW